MKQVKMNEKVSRVTDKSRDHKGSASNLKKVKKIKMKHKTRKRSEDLDVNS